MILQRYFCESFGFDALQFELRRLVLEGGRVTIVSVARAIVSARVARSGVTRTVFRVVVASAVARCVLVTVAPAVVIIEINAGAFL